ncbi:MAG: YHYH domain-containing protein [Rhizobacter sp.]
MKKLAILAAILVTATLSLAHPGGLDKKGCHHDRKNGTYHCH